MMQNINPVTHMFMVEVKQMPVQPELDMHDDTPVHDLNMPHVYSQAYDDYDRFDDPDAKVRVDTDSLREGIERLVHDFRDRFPSDIPAGVPPDRVGMATLHPSQSW